MLLANNLGRKQIVRAAKVITILMATLTGELRYQSHALVFMTPVLTKKRYSKNWPIIAPAAITIAPAL